MASPQKENGFTPIANQLMEALCRTRIPGEARQVLDTILRKTYGWNKKEDSISLSQFVEMTGLKKTHVCRCINKLIDMNIVTQKGNAITQKGNEPSTTYLFQKDFEQWKPLPKKVTLPKKVINVTQKGNSPLPNWGHTKERTKEKKEIRVEIPFWISSECFEAFREMRKKIKKPMTQRAEQLVIKELEKLKENGFDPNDVLDQSTRNNWQDVYPIKEKGNGNKKGDSEVARGLAAFLASEDE